MTYNNTIIGHEMDDIYKDLDYIKYFITLYSYNSLNRWLIQNLHNTQPVSKWLGCLLTRYTMHILYI